MNDLTGKNYKTIKILLIDNEKSVHDLFDEIFVDTYYEISHVYQIDDNLSLYNEQNYDLLLIGSEQIDVKGYELCRMIKTKIRNHYIPIVIISNANEEIDINTALYTGIDDYLLKPLDPIVIIDTITELISKSKKYVYYKILIVDDSKVMRETISRELLKNNYNVLIANNGFEGYNLALTEHPDIIITDVIMPVMDGYELCKKINETPIMRGIPIIMMSSQNKLSDIKKGEKLGITHYIVKPFDTEKLVLIISRILLEKNNLLLKEQEDLLSSIRALINALEARDNYTKGHSQRVTDYSVRFAQYIGFSKFEVAEIEMASVLHDIGKIGIRDDILFKEGKLTSEEYQIIQKHPVIGAEILKPIKSITNIIPLIYHHHERYDGKGYPDKLAGSNIPKGALIIAIADTYDAIRTERSYKKANSKERALNIIQENSGTQFFSEYAEKFIDMMKSEE